MTEIRKEINNIPDDVLMAAIDALDLRKHPPGTTNAEILSRAIMADRSRAMDPKAEPVAYLRPGEYVPIQNAPFGAMWISDKDDPRAFPVYASPSIVAPVAVGDGERDAMRRRIYDDLAQEGGGTWATYVCMDIDALERAAFEAGKLSALTPAEKAGVTDGDEQPPIDRICVENPVIAFPNPRFERDMFRFSLLSEWR
ncbi:MULTISPECIES: hypothetical protein [unclassified Ensifer]|uniref:hypothetical protein n=1 Tax=unclassified Ensifer TaxID=2633371 RepID=UPI00081389C9|nr:MULTISPECIES: hypothetical protein [unclassified Ensifer]OCP01325.1 hypothetical protein BC362_23115 [Ensifer sp. LC14]OCP03217.1 hypothetical protein BBX50_06240 [Ensifer sp. LC11]OCP03587.1 hypothetical protein BC374_06295 [Ensifer sp. LC13]OCP34000.1 hypothetical protein BC364_13785 [Ensifer sp. LC499]